jgi:hypothetical protein
VFVQYDKRYTAMHVHHNAHSDVTVDNPAYVDVAFFTQNGSYNIILTCGTPCDEHSLCRK